MDQGVKRNPDLAARTPPEQFRVTRRLFERSSGWLFLDEKAT
jgi:hypothetical protein